MTRARLDWLDRLAAVSVGGSSREAIPVSDESEDRFSRARAVQLAVAGAAGLWLGLPGLATGRPLEGVDACLSSCTEKYQRAFERDRDACLTAVYGHGGRAGWVGLAAAAALYGPAVLQALVAGTCGQVAFERRSLQASGCQEQCRDSCTKSPGTCSPTTPPKSEAPDVPPPPGPVTGLSCTSCPGVCCDCGWPSGPTCATYVGNGPDHDDICYRNCVG